MPTVTQQLRGRVCIEPGLLQVLDSYALHKGTWLGGQVEAEIQLTLHSPGWASGMVGQRGGGGPFKIFPAVL